MSFFDYNHDEMFEAVWMLTEEERNTILNYFTVNLQPEKEEIEVILNKMVENAELVHQNRSVKRLKK